MVLPVKGHGAMHQDVEENTQGPAVHLRKGRGDQQGCPHATGWGASGLTSVSEKKGYTPENSEASSSENHLPLVPRSRAVTLREGLRLMGAGVVNPFGRGCRQHKSGGEVTPAGPGVGGWLGAGEGDGN